VFVSAVVNLATGPAKSGPARPDPVVRQTLVGVVGGIIRGAVSMGGPPIVLYQHWIGGGALLIRGKLFAYFFWVGVPATLMAVPTGVFGGPVMKGALLALPALAVGIVIGRLVRPSLSEAWFRRSSMIMLALTAAVAAIGVLRTAYL
ncbi:MAG: hypothetical protein O2798_11480, partial [Chloroflexi bacterium]|nr:hypothetical protein [Chloroflexota bacterium]